ncbi:PREDICTED: beta-catenin-like protein 1 [Priapulus caudatus]|uniref:Beta-catenin-like protein 1 n=1 Tax=Priapulus caudatus TaxID=37621 RepID=A0ABM1E8J1_PRICU|nr:PREDICTED: beta-catenin-like protein 1 [Priapulus caudatus]
MNVGELLTFQPVKGVKRAPDEDDDDANIARFKSKKKVSGESGFDQRKAAESERDRILELVDQEPEAPPIDESQLKKMLLTFEKRVVKNQEMRIKFQDKPEKFMDSEIELNEIVQELHVVATMPELYHILVELHTVQSLLGLLSHDNTDISVAVVSLLQELTDTETLTESEEDVEILIDALMKEQLVGTLVQNMERLDETVPEEAEGVHNTLATVENLVEYHPEFGTEAAQQGLLQWILKRLKAKLPFDNNKLYASEILSILLQGNNDTRQLLGELDGIDVLLQQVNVYKKHDPSNNEEIEMMENLFDCLCSALMVTVNRGRFLKGEGLQLMNLMLRERKLSRSSALKVLDYAMIGPEGADNGTKFVDILGLRTIFPMFMKTPKGHKKKNAGEEEHEEHVSSVITSLLKNTSGTQRQRLLAKFTENDHAKVDRLMELHFKYLEKVHHVDNQIEKERQRLKASAQEISEGMEEDFYLRRLDAGLFTLQLVDYVMMEVCSSGASSIKQRVLQMLNLRGGSIKTIRNIMREYAGNIGDDKDPETRDAEQKRLLQLVDKF